MNVSFGSNYKINQRANFPFEALDQVHCLQRNGVEVDQKFAPFKEACETGIFSTIYINSPDKMDKFVETILVSNNINFHKSSIEEALDINNIISRIEVEPSLKNTHTLVEIDVDKFNELFKQDGLAYIEPEGDNGIGKRYAGVKEYLKTGRPIDATLVYVNDFCGMPRATISDGRHRFAVFRDMGIKKLPVAMDETSIANAKKFGLI